MQSQAITEFRRLIEQWTQDFLAANQDGCAIGVPTEKFKDGWNGDRWTVVTSHAIYGNRYRHCENGRALPHPAASDSTNYSPLTLMTFLPR